MHDTRPRGHGFWIGYFVPAETLRYLVEQHGLKQTDLADELGGQSMVSAILNDKRELNARQVKALAKRFNVSPAAFL